MNIFHSRRIPVPRLPQQTLRRISETHWTIIIDNSEGGWERPTVRVTVDSKRRVTIPASLLKTKPGQAFDVLFDADENALVFRKLPEKEDWLDVLMSCPYPMDDIPPRSREFPKKLKL